MGEARKLHIQFISAAAIPPNDFKLMQEPSCDPFCAVYLAREPETVLYGTVAEDQLDPVWPEEGNKGTLGVDVFDQDVLEIQVWDKDHKQFGPDGKPYKKCKTVSTGQLYLSTVQVGKLITLDVPLKSVKSRKDKKGYDKTYGGTLKILVNILPPDAEPFTELPEDQVQEVQALTAVVSFVSAKNLPAADRQWYKEATSDPYIVAKVKGQDDSTKKTTRHIDNNLNPVWNETRSFVIGSKADVLEVEIWDRDRKSADDLLSVVEVPFADCQVGEDAQTDFIDLQLTRKYKAETEGEDGGLLTLYVKLLPPDVQTRDITFCTFDWGDLNSSYASSFASYDTAHGKHFPLGPETEDEKMPEGYHVHREIVGVTDDKVKRKKTTFTGVVKDLSGAYFTGVSSNIVVNIVSARHGRYKGPGKPTQPVIAEGTSDLQFDFNPVPGGQWLAIVFLQRGQPFAIAKKKIKDFPLGEDQETKLDLVKFNKDDAAITVKGTVTVIASLRIQEGGEDDLLGL